MQNEVIVAGMVGETYFSDSPVIIEVAGLEWPASSPFTTVKLTVYTYAYRGRPPQRLTRKIGTFLRDANQASRVEFDISEALKSAWSDYDFEHDVAAAENAYSSHLSSDRYRPSVSYLFRISKEYISPEDGNLIIEQCTDSDGNYDFDGGKCVVGRFSEWERRDLEDADVTLLQDARKRYGNGSTKPTDSPERVGLFSITSWVSVTQDGTHMHFFCHDERAESDTEDPHNPIVIRDTRPCYDFLFINRRGALETCSAFPLENMGIDNDTQSYRNFNPLSFRSAPSLFSIAESPRRKWGMSSGYVTREWAEWWSIEFLAAKRWWMMYKGSFVPVLIEPAKKTTTIYDRTSPQMAHIPFSVTLPWSD